MITLGSTYENTCVSEYLLIHVLTLEDEAGQLTFF